MKKTCARPARRRRRAAPAAGIRLRVLTAAALAVTFAWSQGSACGYHDPQLVQRGFLNWIYPDSLHVIGAMTKEVAARRLPPPDAAASPDLFGGRYRAATLALKQFGGLLASSGTPVALVLVEPMLWTRFEQGPRGIAARVHVEGAEAGDLVLVSGEVVIREIAAGRLTIGEAAGRGLIRLYGSQDQIARFLRGNQHAGFTGSETLKAGLDAGKSSNAVGVLAGGPAHR